MFKKILIANRGEIACRVMRTAKRLGIKTVAVYSDADADALHVREADEAVRIGLPPSAESYLKIDAIIEACRTTGAEAVHPGYGFLSEKAEFAKALEAAGIVFIGPNVEAIGAMGDKIESKKLARDAGVSMVPGHLEVIPDADAAIVIARQVGYPVMVKASAGGGGKGMRIARSDEETREGFRSAQNEARSSFGDDRIFIEKYIEQPRHIEIQVLGDSHGNVVYLGERECSIQRRHQKVIEEAPSPFLDPATREAMGEQAVALAKAVNYRSAGTVEFIVDKDKKFYFLEMNTRLQVEHPVTECVTGVDLVELMIRVAAGEKLPFTQKDIKLNGWALEARVYAEDPFRNFLPSIGRLTHYQEPEGEGVRVDAGVFEGAEISMFYDPMIAKLIASAPTRDGAIARLMEALDSYEIRGVSHNISFLAALVGNPRFAKGDFSTNFIAEEFAGGFVGAELNAAQEATLIIVAATVQRIQTDHEAEINGQLPGHEVKPVDEWVVCLGDARHPVTVKGYTVAKQDRSYQLETPSGSHEITTSWLPGRTLFRATLDGKTVTFQVDRVGIGYRLFHAGASRLVKILPPRAAELLDLMPVKQPPDLSRFLLSPMPGLLVRVEVTEGQEVKAGEELAAVEAMKMENILRAERDGRIAKIRVKAGESLAVDQVILEFD